VIPLPVQVPPLVAAFNVTGEALTHNTGGEVIVASAFDVTVINAVSVFPQLPGIVYVTVYVPVPAVAGSNVPLAPDVMPVPVQVPPAVAALKLNGADPMQTGATLFIVASASGDTVRVTVEEEAAQGAFEIVHSKVFAPIPNPVTPDAGEEGVVIVPAPPTSVHVPVPVRGVFPASVAVLPHIVCGTPALAVVGGSTPVIVTVDDEEVQGELEMVH
jgi:hypothetical protein